MRITPAMTGVSAVSGCSIARLSDGRYRMYFSELPIPGAGVVALKTLSATSTDLATWTMDAGVRIGTGAPSLTGSAEHPASWANPSGSITLLYFRNSNLTMYSSTSSDGLNFTAEASTGLSLANDPDIVRVSGSSLRMYYNWGDNVSGTVSSATGTEVSSLLGAFRR